MALTYSVTVPTAILFSVLLMSLPYGRSRPRVRYGWGSGYSDAPRSSSALGSSETAALRLTSKARPQARIRSEFAQPHMRAPLRGATPGLSGQVIWQDQEVERADVQAPLAGLYELGVHGPYQVSPGEA